MSDPTEQPPSGGDKIFFMSKPTTTIADRRTWLVRLAGEASQLVRVYPDRENQITKFVCDCKRPNCKHVDAAIAADDHRFIETKKEINIYE